MTKLDGLKELRTLYYEAQRAKLRAQQAATAHDLLLTEYIFEHGPVDGSKGYEPLIAQLEQGTK